ncbi:MAG: TonB-dependent receptor [Telluria sp.]
MLRKTVVARALSIAFSTAAMSAMVFQPAHAQSNAAGTVYGKVAAGAATSVVIRNTDTNQQRTVQLDPSGAFTATSLQPGHYRATLQGGSMNGKTSEADVIAGQGSEFVFVTGDVAARVEVTGRRSRIDVSSATNGATFTARELEKLPVAHNVDAIIQLAPNTTRSDPTYIAGHSIGGGGPSENAYYINGFPVTNPLTQLGASELPFGAIATAEIKTGGYGAEFGRSIGGVINITGKSGTNNWEFGALASTTPAKWRSKMKDAYYPVIGASNTTTTDGTLRIRNEDNTRAQQQYGAYVGGPIIKDKLFMFVSGERTTTDVGEVYSGRTSTALATQGYRKYTTKTDRYYTKFDWNITDDHRLEYSSFGDVPDTTTSFYSYNYTSRAVGAAPASTIHTKDNGANGGETQLLRYTGNLTDDFTITSMYGVSKAKHVYEPVGYLPNVGNVSATNDVRAPGLNYNSGQTIASNVTANGATDEVKAFRVDLEYKIGQHTVRGGIDNNKISSLNAGESYPGGVYWIYGKTDTPTQPFAVSGGTVPAVAGFGPLASQGFYVQKAIYSTVSSAYAGQTAQYLEDRWQVTKNFLATIGIRNEGFYNANSNGEKYINQKNSYLPRLSAIWDVNGDSSFKVFGSAGRYSVPIPTLVALRGANGSLNTSQYFAYTGTDSNGQPTGLTQLTSVLSANNEYGQPKDPKTLAAIDMKPSYQDEMTLGFERAWSPDVNFGAKFTYRTLTSTIDDFCDQRPFDKYAAAHNINEDNYGGFNCASFNPGQANSFWVDYAGTQSNYTKVDLSAADLGFEKAERKYTAVDLFLEHPYRNGWYGKVNYTWSKDKGNTEGQTLSDPNSGQADVSATMAWDYAEIMRGANGLLPNDRTHQIKAFGWYDITNEWTVGGNLDIESGRPMGCLGKNPAPNPGSPNYSYEHYCLGTGNYTTNVYTPRGTLGRYPWSKTLDLNLVYRPAAIKGLSFKLDMFNVTNDQTMTKRLEQYNAGTLRSGTYGGVLYYADPRSAKFTAEYNHKF